MEWVETTGRTVDDAKEAALDQLGVDERDAEFEVVEEPRTGLFGRMRGEARVRARVRPDRSSAQGRAHELGDRRKSGGQAGGAEPAKDAGSEQATSVGAAAGTPDGSEAATGVVLVGGEAPKITIREWPRPEPSSRQGDSKCVHRGRIRHDRRRDGGGAGHHHAELPRRVGRGVRLRRHDHRREGRRRRRSSSESTATISVC